MSLGSLLCDTEGKPQAKLLLQILHYTATPTSQPGGPIRHIYTLPSVASPIPTLCGPCHKYQIRDRAVMHAPFSAPKHVGARLPHGPIPPLLPPAALQIRPPVTESCAKSGHRGASEPSGETGRHRQRPVALSWVMGKRGVVSGLMVASRQQGPGRKLGRGGRHTRTRCAGSCVVVM